MAHTVSLGRRPVRRRTRGERVQSLVAAGVVPTYEMTQGSEVDQLYHDLAVRAGHTEFTRDSWPSSVDALTKQELTHVIARDDGYALLAFPDGTLAKVGAWHGFITVRVAGATIGAMQGVLAAFRQAHPVLTLEVADTGEFRVPITFWTNGPFGASSRMRMIAAQPWSDIAGNYPPGVRSELDALMTTFRPDGSGQLLLWQGPPGTGKTWGLRALASAWSPWAEFHYITDPDSFFVDEPSYMIDVLLSDSYAMVEPDSGALVEESDPEAKWRVLLLEDTGELLAANAKEKYGQGLSRLLNVVDGMIGQGLKILCVVTTNDELGDLNPAVLRPGRCASQVVFRALSPEEAAEWAGEQVDADATIAELYARRGNGEPALGGDEPVQTAQDDASGAVTASAAPDALRQVAEAHAPDGGYGDTWWSEESASVFWNAADWSGEEEIDAARDAFMAVEGVDAFEYDYEVGDMSSEGYKRIWPEPSPDAAAEALRLASEPLIASLTPAGEDAVLAAVRERLDLRPEEEGVVRDALRTLAAAHRNTVEGVTSALASLAGRKEQVRGDALALALTGVLGQFAAKPAPRPAPVHVHQAPVSVNVEGPTVQLPAQHTTVTVPEREQHLTVHVDAPEPALVDVDVHVPAQEPQRVDVHVPPAPAPVVHVHERSAARAVRTEYDAAGNRRFVVERDDETED